MKSPMSKLLLLPLLLLAVACGSGEPAAENGAANNAAEASGEPAAAVDRPADEDADDASPDPEAAPAEPAPAGSPLLDPDHPDANRTAPAEYRARFRTTEGDFVVRVERAWAPLGADRFYNLVRAGFYDDTYFFRVVDGFVAQFGVSGQPEVNAAWSWAELQDDPVEQSNRRGTLVFATAGPDTRTTQLFINLGDNTNLDGMGFSPFGEVVEGMDVVARLYSGYGDGPPYGSGPDQGRIEDEGNAYLERDYPELDRIVRARIE